MTRTMNLPTLVRWRSSVVLAASIILLATNAAVAYELRTTASVGRARPDDHGYTSFWESGVDAGLGAEVIPDRWNNVGLAVWTEFAELPGRTNSAYGDSAAISSWRQTRLYAGVRAHFRPIPAASGFAITADLATGRGVMDFGEVRVPMETIPANRQWGDVFTFGAGIEFVGDRFGAFADVRSELFGDSVNYTWNTVRFGLIWRAKRSPEDE